MSATKNSRSSLAIRLAVLLPAFLLVCLPSCSDSCGGRLKSESRPDADAIGWTQLWNGEDRLASATKGTTRLEFRYDYMGAGSISKV